MTLLKRHTPTHLKRALIGACLAGFMAWPAGGLLAQAPVDPGAPPPAQPPGPGFQPAPGPGGAGPGAGVTPGPGPNPGFGGNPGFGPNPGGVGGPLRLQWNKVAGSDGYIVEIQDENGELRLRRETTENEIRFGLPAGQYRQRIGVLNKFKKVSVWSNWRPLLIRRPGDPVITSISPKRVATGQPAQAFEIRGRNIYRGSKVSILLNGVLVPFRTRDARPGEINLQLNTKTVKPGRYRVIIENPGGRRTRSPDDLVITRAGRNGKPLAEADRWNKLIPGLYQARNGQPGKAAFWMTTFGALAAGGAGAILLGDQAAAATANDPLINLVFNPVYLFAIQGSITSRQQGLFLAAAAYDRIINNRFQYDTAQNVQTGIAVTAGVLYVLQYVDASDGDFATAVPGGKQPAWRATLYWSLLGAIAGAGFSEFVAAEATIDAATNDPLISLYSDPTLSLVMLGGETRTDQNLLLAGLSMSRNAEYQATYQAHQSNISALSAAAALIYFGHFIDLSFSDAGLSMELQYVPPGLFAAAGNASGTATSGARGTKGRASEGFAGVNLHMRF